MLEMYSLQPIKCKSWELVADHELNDYDPTSTGKM